MLFTESQRTRPKEHIATVFGVEYTLKMEALHYSEMTVDFELSTQRYIPEDNTFYSHCFENLISYKFKLVI
jgi:hypothetical protein